MIVPCSAVDSFSNPKVLAVIVQLQKAEIGLRLFSKPSNSGGARAPQAPPLSTPLQLKELNPSIETIEIEKSPSKYSELTCQSIRYFVIPCEMHQILQLFFSYLLCKNNEMLKLFHVTNERTMMETRVLENAICCKI